MTGFKSNSFYKINEADDQGNKLSQVLFNAIEFSDDYKRQWCCATCRELKIFIENNTGGAIST